MKALLVVALTFGLLSDGKTVNPMPIQTANAVIPGKSFRLTWDRLARQVNGYLIYSSTNGIDFEYAGETTPDVTSSVVSAALPVWWRVTAWDNSSESLPSNIVWAMETNNVTIILRDDMTGTRTVVYSGPPVDSKHFWSLMASNYTGVVTSK